MVRLLVSVIIILSAEAFQPALRRPSPPTTTQASSSTHWHQRVTTTILPVFLAGTLAISPALAVDSTVFNNEYADPFHPFCHRKIEVSRDGKTFHYSGTAVGPKGEEGPLRGCSPEEIKTYKVRQGAFDGEILAPGNRISAGDGIHEGVWEPTNSAAATLAYADVDGIRWNDGNKWIVRTQSAVKQNSEGKYYVTKKPISTVVGEGIFYAYIGFSTLAGVKGIADGVQRKRQQL
jgi:hypothetical protein